MSSNLTKSTDDYLNEYNPFTNHTAVPPTSVSNLPPPTFTPAVRPVPTISSKATETTPIFATVVVQETAPRPISNVEEINQRESELRSSRSDSNSNVEKSNNFPPFPTCIPCKPCFYQDFDVEINSLYRPTVKLGFYLWLSNYLLLFVNIFGTLCYMISQNMETSSSTNFGVSILLFILLGPLAYILWFRPLYKCLRSQSSVNFFAFFIFIAVHIVIDAIQCLGINWVGSCGWFNSIATFSGHIGIACFMIVITVGFTLLVVMKVFLVIKVHRLYRSSDASLASAKRELAQETVKNVIYS